MTRPQPLRQGVAALLRVAPGLAPRLRKLVWRLLYEAVSVGSRSGRVTVMNYGFAPLDAEAEGWPPDDRFGLQLYAKVAAGADLRDRDVLEVGCGRGGGAAFVLERAGPKSMTGLDLAHTAIARGRASNARPGLNLVVGDAENLPFPDGAFGAVLSVESSHCYSDVGRFLAEVHRVLAPDGVLLLADLRNTTAGAGAGIGVGDLPSLRAQLAAAGFRTAEEEDITQNVVLALAENTPAVRARIEQRVPRFLREHALAFAAAEGSHMHRRLAGGEMTYMRFTLVKT